jgi:hypothetical protein
MESNVRVGVRVRPYSANEIAAESRSAVSHPGRNMVSIGDGAGDKSFTVNLPSLATLANLISLSYKTVAIVLHNSSTTFFHRQCRRVVRPK